MTTVRLDSEQNSLVLACADGALPCVDYWGARLPDDALVTALGGLHRAPVFQGGLDAPYRLNLFPEGGTGFRGVPALQGARGQKGWANRFELVSHQQTGAGEVSFIYTDKAAALDLTIELMLDYDSNVLARRTILQNSGRSAYDVHYCAASALPIPTFCTSVMKFHGCWTGEFMTETIPLSQGIIQVDNRTGRTSHEHFPAMIALAPGAGESSGRVYGMHLGFSGNFRFFAEQVADGSKQLQCGELFYPGEKVLKGGESYVSPWAYAACSEQGLNGLSANYHKFFRSQIETALVKRERPVQLNTWEAVYFDHDIDELKRMADKAAELGIERFVLDDGWFHGRNDDSSSLGDWWPDARKYPAGLTPLSDHVTGLGLQFGLWVEPEMVNEESELYRNHPDWVLGLDDHPIQRGRNQLVLNLSKAEVAAYLFEKLDGLLTQYPVAYIKWDMNRILTEPGHDGKAAVSQQTAAFYALLDRLRKSHPEVEFESCSSGGGRIDYEVLKRAERVWGSDSNDPLRRLQIQQGASYFFPPEIIGSHVGPEHCHTTARVSTLPFRAAVSLCCHFGFELNILKLTSEEEQHIKNFSKLYKQSRQLLHSGTYVRLDKQKNNRFGYGVVAQDQSEAIFFIHQSEIDDHSSDRAIVLTGLDDAAQYDVERLYGDANTMPEINGPLPGRFLMEWGLSAYFRDPGTCLIYRLKRT